MDKKYIAEIGDVEIISNNETEFISKCCAEIVNLFKNEPDEKMRLKSYIDYLVDKAKYNLKFKEDYYSGKVEYNDSFENSTQSLANFFENGNGVCQQFSQALNLICVADGKLNSYYTSCAFIKDNIEVGHALNICILDNNLFVVDISAATHCKDGQFSSKKNSFLLVPVHEYLKNFNNEGCRMLASFEKSYIKDLEKDENILECLKDFNKKRINENNITANFEDVCFFIIYDHYKKTFEEVFKFINLPPDKINDLQKEQGDILRAIWTEIPLYNVEVELSKN